MWLIYPFTAAALYAVTNLIEKYAIDKRIKNPYILTVVGGMIVFAIGILIFIIRGSPPVPLQTIAVILIAGMFLEWYLLPYFQALMMEDASRIVPLFEFSSIFSLVFSAIILQEFLTLKQLIGFAVIFCGGLVLAAEGSDKGLKWLKPRKAFWFMMVSGILYVFSNILFKFTVIKLDFWTTLAYQYLGVGLGTVLMLPFIYKKTGIQELVTQMKPGITIIFTIDKLIETFAHILQVFAMTLAPVALVGIIGNTQPFFVFIFGTVLSIWFPHLIKEDISKHTVLVKLGSMTIMFIGMLFIT